VEFIGSAIKLSSRGAGDSFVARYNPNGQLIWALRAGGTAGDIGLGLAVEDNGNAVVTGNFSGQATFADIDSPAAATLTSAGRIDGFVTKYDPQGQLIWARRAGAAMTAGAASRSPATARYMSAGRSAPWQASPRPAAASI
jgi:hypothetical protein